MSERPRYLIDFETRSACDLKRRGAHVYAEHPSTRLLCLSWVNLNNRAHRGNWRAWPEPQDPPEHLFHPDAERWAWNASFEQLIWNNVGPDYGWPEVDPDSFHCLMKRAALAGLPLSLDLALAAEGAPVAKNMDGHKIMLKWCKPLPVRKSDPAGLIRWADDPVEYEILCDYADDDIHGEEWMFDRLYGHASAFEIEMMRIDRMINDRGFRIDVEAAEGAAKIARQEIKRLNADMSRLTNGRITTCNQRDRILDFAAGFGVELPNLRSATVRDSLSDEEDEMDGLAFDMMSVQMPPIVRQVLELRYEANKASVAKLDAMVRGVGDDGYFRGGFAYCGAAKTGRAAGRRVQPHNFARMNPPKDVAEDVWFDALKTGDREYFASLLPEGWSVMDGLKASLRGLIIP